MHTLKIFDADASAVAAIPGARIVETYPAFVVAEVEDAGVEAITRNHLVEDISSEYEIASPGGSIDSALPRISRAGEIERHPSYGDEALPRGPHHYLVQFRGPIKRAWLTALKRAGGEVVAPWSGFTMVVRAKSSAVRDISALPAVRWMGHLPYSARLAPGALRVAETGEADPLTPRSRFLPGSYVVEFFRSDLAAAGQAKVRRLGFEVVDFAPRASVMIVRAKVARAGKNRLEERLRMLTRVHGVKRVAPQAMRRTTNDVAAVVMKTASALGATAAGGLGLSGAGEIIGVCDTGLDNGDLATIHPDFRGRVVAMKSYPIAPSYAPFVYNPGGDDGPADIDSGHGTHTAGSVLGDGSASTNLLGRVGPIRGLSHGARLVFQAIEQEMKWKDPEYDIKPGRYLLAGLPTDLKPLFQWAYTNGARIHSNSWGGGEPGAYDEQCEQLDAFVWAKPDFCILFSAGNDGADRNGDGVVDSGSVTSPGTAKNCITVGASENNRPEFISTYGGSWPEDYPTPPLRDDRLADNPDQMVAFSSRGPTRDGRVKPDVVAPGTYVLSARSRLLAENQYGYGRFGSSTLYMFNSGTSMSTPLTAGAVGLLREYLRQRQQIANPPAALLKAALIAGATSLQGAPRPNTDEGFGRVNLDAILAPKAPRRALFLEGPGLRTGEQVSRTITLAPGGGPLKVVMAYSDFPGPRLVNNLNLILTSPDGENYVGNGQGAQIFDSRNNVEVIELDASVAGDWRVRVVGSNIANGPQPFALVILGQASWKR